MSLTFPRHVYGRDGVFRIMHEAEAYQSALSEGWTDTPPEPCEVFVIWDGEPLVFDTGDPEVGTTDAPSPLLKRKPGRPKKEQS